MSLARNPEGAHAPTQRVNDKPDGSLHEGERTIKNI